ncbi:MAG: ABC transporter substrate-binding protein [Oscillospiraceae bacterium]|nr:ABC transporter substrate-binding protein [Oscillospiraceae bacterium]
MKYQFVLKILSLLLTLTFLFSACGTTQEQNAASLPTTDSANLSAETVTLPYSKDDGFNPYLTTNILTMQNAGLLFCKILTINPSFNLEYEAAASVTVSGTTVTIAPSSSCRFSNGAAVTAQDILTSLNLAWQSESYRGRFVNVGTIEQSGNQVIITLIEPDSMFAYLLDLPVLNTNDAYSTQPMSSGRYTYGGNGLVPNPYYAGTLNVQEIVLTNLTGYDSLVSNLNIGNISILDSEGKSDISSSTATRQSNYKLNHMVFLGLNSQGTYYVNKDVDGVVLSVEDLSTVGQKFLANASARNAISQLISRQLLSEKGYYGKAYPALGVINSLYPCVIAQQTISGQSNTDTAIAAIEALGYTKHELDGFYYDARDRRLSLRLLCYAGNSYKRYTAQLIKEQLSAIGIEVVLEETDNFETYTQKIASKQFDMYIGEVKLYNNMDMSPFFADTGAAQYGLTLSAALLESYAAFKADATTAPAFEQVFAAEMPFIPLVWTNGVVFHSKSISGLTATLSDIFYNFGEVQVAAAAN